MAGAPDAARKWRWLAGLLVLGVAGWLAWPYALAVYHLRLARQAMDDREIPRACDSLAVCLRAWPNRADVRLLAARAARLAGRPDEAREHLDAVPDEPGHRHARALERALLEAGNGMFLDYEEFLRRQLEQDPGEALAILDVLTFQYMRADRLVEAQRYLERWLELRPGDVEALARLGYVAEHLFDKDAAIRHYTEVLERQPGRDAIRLRLAELLLGKNSALALEHFERLRQDRPSDPAVLLGLARCRLGRAELDEAAELLDELQRHAPDHDEALVERGRLELARRRPAEAEKWLRQALGRKPHDRAANYNLLRCLQALGKDAEAEKVRVRLEQIDADLARMSRLMPQVQQRPTDADLRCEVGRIFLRNGLTSDGVRWLHTALECAPEHRGAHEALAEHHARQGNAEQAAKHKGVLRRLKEGGPGR